MRAPAGFGIAAFVAVASLTLSAGPAAASTIAFTDLSGRQWRQVTETDGLSWNQLNFVCSTGTCTADFGAYDLAGWTWASQDDVRSLFNEFIFAATGTNPLGSDYSAPGSTSTWASSFVSYFALTYVEPVTGDGYVNGWASTAASASDGFGPSIRDCNVAFNASCQDRANVSDFYDKSMQFPDIAGAFLYRPAAAAPVPEPSTMILCSSVLAAAGLRRLRRRGPAARQRPL